MYDQFMLSSQFIKKAILNPLEDQKCHDLHPGSCNLKAWHQTVIGTKGTIPLYSAVHILPFLFKLKKAAKNPRQETIKLIKGFIKSMLFVSTTQFLLRRMICAWTKLYGFSGQPGKFVVPWFVGFPLLLFQSPGRQMEMGLYNLKQGIYSFYLLLHRRYPSLYIKNGEVWLFAISVALVSYYYMTAKLLFKQGYQKTLDLIYKDI